MPTVIEKKLAFDFPADWEIAKYDRQVDLKSGEPASFYRRVIEKGGVQNVQGMDVVCRLPNAPAHLQFIEIKDERKRTLIAAKRHNELYKIVLSKTVGTLAGLLLAERLQEVSLQSQACLTQNPVVEVVLFLVEPLPVPISAEKNDFRRLNKQDQVTLLDQRLSSKLGQWDLAFRLYNLTDRPALLWQVRDLA